VLNSQGAKTRNKETNRDNRPVEQQRKEKGGGKRGRGTTTSADKGTKRVIKEKKTMNEKTRQPSVRSSSQNLLKKKQVFIIPT